MSNPTQASELMELLDIEFDEITSTRVSGSAAADERHHQPWGIVHGGLYTAVIETFAITGRRRCHRGVAEKEASGCAGRNAHAGAQ
jgi:acyl-coenzyme A thioesterase PaaI-like protein